MNNFKMKHIGINMLACVPSLIFYLIVFNAWLKIPDPIAIFISVTIWIEKSFMESKIDYLQDEINKINNRIK